MLQAHIRWPFILFSLACTLLLSWLSFRFYESPFLNLKERWTVRP
jgi:peptidoglycan/LPS O-acetylase OafA/YrhL